MNERNNHNLLLTYEDIITCYANDTVLAADSEENLKEILEKVIDLSKK